MSDRTASAVTDSPSRTADLVLDRVLRAGHDGAALAHLYESVDAKPATIRKAVGRLVEEGAIVPVGAPGAGLYRAARSSGVVVRENSPLELVPDRARELPEYDVVANAGGWEGRIYDLTENSDSVVGRYFVDPREVASIPDDEAFVVRVFGTSMVPDFHPGDRVVCRRYNGGWEGLVDGHYLIRIGGRAYVKALQRLPRRRVRVNSTNEASFPAFEIDLNDGEDPDVEALAVVYGHFKRYWE